jgi:WD40 repeat protein
MTPTATLPPAIGDYRELYAKSISPDGRLIVTSESYLGFINIYRRSDAKLMRRFKDSTSSDPTPAINSIAFSHDSKRFLVASSITASRLQPSQNPLDCHISLWETASGKKLHAFTTSGSPAKVTFAPDGRSYAGSFFFKIALYRSSDGKQLWAKRPPYLFISTGGGVSSGEHKLAFSKDGKLLALAGIDGGVSIYRTKDGHLLANQAATASEETPEINGLFFSADGKSLFIIATRVLLWRAPWDGTIAQREKVIQQNKSSYKYNSVAASPDGKFVAAASYKGIDIWRLADGAKLYDATQKTTLDNCDALRFTSDGRHLIGITLSKTSQRAGMPKVWNYRAALALPTTPKTRVPAVRAVPASKVRSPAASSQQMSQAFTTGLPILPFSGIILPATSNQSLIAGILAGKSNYVVVNPHTKRQSKARFSDLYSTGTNVSNQGQWRPLRSRIGSRPIVIKVWQGTLQVRDARTDALLRTLGNYQKGLQTYVVASGLLACSYRPVQSGQIPQSQPLAAQSDNWLTVFDMASGKKLYTIKDAGDISTIALSHNGKFLAVGAMSKQIQLHNARTGQLLKTAQGYRGGVYHLNFSADDNLLRCLVQSQYQEWRVG